jgi:hypothetical protein
VERLQGYDYFETAVREVEASKKITKLESVLDCRYREGRPCQPPAFVDSTPVDAQLSKGFDQQSRSTPDIEHGARSKEPIHKPRGDISIRGHTAPEMRIATFPKERVPKFEKSDCRAPRSRVVGALFEASSNA